MLAFCRWKQFRFREALTLFYAFQKLAGKSAILLENIGHTHNSLGETDKAEECFEEALDRIDKGEKGNKGGLLMGLGIVKKSRGDLQGSVRILYKALRFYQESYKGIEHSIVAKCHTSVGRSLEALNEIFKAEHHFYEAVRIFWLTCGYSPLTANAIKKFADLKLLLQRPDEAQQLYRQSLELHVEFDTLDMRAIIEIVNQIPLLHLTQESKSKLSRPGLSQYLPSIQRFWERTEFRKTDGNLAVAYKSMAEITAIPGGDGCRVAKSMLEKALAFFRVTDEADCTRLIAQSEKFIEICDAQIAKTRTGKSLKADCTRLIAQSEKLFEACDQQIAEIDAAKALESSSSSS